MTSPERVTSESSIHVDTSVEGFRSDSSFQHSPRRGYPHLAGGVKGTGMIGTVGIAAAITNAVFHATGVQFRDLPIRLEQLIGDRG